MSDFDWMKTTVRARQGATLSTRAGELEHRARLLARLGFPKKRAEERLRQNLTWEYERLGSASVDKKLAGIVNEAYEREGKAAPKRRSPARRP
jgi:hypothetical protein